MSNTDCWDVWAPEGVVWSDWAKPAPFTAPGLFIQPGPLTNEEFFAPYVAKLGSFPDLCLVVDLPGPDSVTVGVLAAAQGYRPVPLVNTTVSGGQPAAINMGPYLSCLCSGGGRLAAVQLPADAKPAFLLDSGRLGVGYTPTPRTYDNRWMTFPQDFPSGHFLLGRGIRRAMLIVGQGGIIADDLQHVLYGWQEAGMSILYEVPGDAMAPTPVTVPKPSGFKSALRRFFAMFGFKRNSAGGFGSLIPQPSQGGGYG